MALNKFILDILNGKETTDRSFETWRDEILAEQQQTHAQQMTYLQHIFQPRNEYENQVNEFLETNTTLRDEYIKAKTSGSLHRWLSHYSNIPEKINISEIHTAFS